MTTQDALQVTCMVKDLAAHDTCAMHDTHVKLRQSAACGMVCVDSVMFTAMQLQQMSGYCWMYKQFEAFFLAICHISTDSISYALNLYPNPYPDPETLYQT